MGDMERKFKIIEWDEFLSGAVPTHWTQEHTVTGMVWRVVMDRGETLVAVPYAAGANVNLEGRGPVEERDGEEWPVLTEWEKLIDEATEKELRETLAEHDVKRCGRA